MISWSQIIKRFIALDVIWGGRSKKVGGVRDGKNVYFGRVQFVAPNILIFPDSDIPDWMRVGKYIRPTSGAGSNLNVKMRIQEVDTINAIVLVEENVVSVPQESVTIDGRMAVVIGDINIAKTTREGDTMFNVHNMGSTGDADGSGISKNFIQHFHDLNDLYDMGDEFPFGAPITHTRNAAGGRNAQTGAPQSWCAKNKEYIAINPEVVIGNDGQIVKALPTKYKKNIDKSLHCFADPATVLPCYGSYRVTEPE